MALLRWIARMLCFWNLFLLLMNSHRYNFVLHGCRLVALLGWKLFGVGLCLGLLWMLLCCTCFLLYLLLDRAIDICRQLGMCRMSLALPKAVRLRVWLECRLLLLRSLHKGLLLLIRFHLRVLLLDFVSRCLYMCCGQDCYCFLLVLLCLGGLFLLMSFPFGSKNHVP